MCVHGHACVRVSASVYGDMIVRFAADGLPQKASYPQEAINEIHGSWFDPSNPVVKYSGSLKAELFPRLRPATETADLVIVLGTSLSGLNADQVAVNTAWRSREESCLGTVIINLQQTPQDGKATVRLFGKSDDVMSLLLKSLGCAKVPRPTFKTLESRVLVPYDKNGQHTDGQTLMWWDLREAQKIKLCAGHNIQGARQPQLMHIGAPEPFMRKGEKVMPAPGNGVVVRRDDASCSLQLMIEGASMRLGVWWLDAARRGTVESLPIVNIRPEFEIASKAKNP